MRHITALPAVFAACLSLLCSCEDEIKQDNGSDGDGTQSAVPEILLNSYAPRSYMGMKMSDLSGRSVKLGTRKVQPVIDENGKWTIGPVDDDYLEMTVYKENAQLPFGSKADDRNAKIPFSQFYATTIDAMKDYPLFAKKNRYGNYSLKDGFAMLDIQVNGTGSVNSIKVKSRNGNALSADGLDFVVLNCIREGSGPVTLPARFQIPVQAGTYGDLDIYICDSKHQMKRTTASVPAFAAGDVKSLNIDYSPSSIVLFYEGFDNCVWGADPAGQNKGYAPDSVNPGIDGRTTATGYEQAYTEVQQGVPGTGYMTPNSWNNANTVDASHKMSESYIRSRAFMDWKYLFRVQEYQGCIGVGVNYQYRGWVETPVLSNLTAKTDVELTFRFNPVDGWNEGLDVACLDGGEIVGFSFDGVAQTDASGNDIWATGKSLHAMASTGVTSGWHEVMVTVRNATSSTRFQFRGTSTSGSDKHGFYLDDITVRKAQPPVTDIPGLSDLTTLSKAELSFKLKFEDYAAEPLKISLPTGGFFTGMKIDGRAVNDEDSDREAWPLKSEYMIDPEQYTSETHDVVFTVESADKDMSVKFEGENFTCTDMAVKKLSSIQKKSFRLLLWNIQFGMWSDQGNNYDNFVNWLKKYDADCCVFIEAETVRKSGSSADESASAKKLNGASGGTVGWSTLAKRYNHNYVAVSADKDNYSQEVTSKTSVTRVLEIYDTGVSGKPIKHGAGYFTLNAGGRKINIVTYHAMPYNYDPNAADQDASAAAREGDLYRLHEVQYLMKQTVLSSKYSSENNWIFLGDMNSHSPVDNWYYRYSSTQILSVQDYIRNNTGLSDVIAEKYPGRFMPSLMDGRFRIDYVYASSSMMNAVTEAVVIRDKWTSERPSNVSDCTHPSDHRPILVDFEF
ncbi:MAG: hypothetical protein E7111_05585 [Bacteroidales bacterium]|nr:hypothetical protein [Bacteroidales bacterium]